MFYLFLTFLFGVIATLVTFAVIAFVLLSVKRKPSDVAAIRAASLQQQLHSLGTAAAAPRKVTFRDWIDVQEEEDARRGLRGSFTKYDSSLWMQEMFQHAANLMLSRGDADAFNASAARLANRVVHSAGIGVHASRWMDEAATAADGTKQSGSTRDGLASAGSTNMTGSTKERRLLDGLISKVHIGSLTFLVPASAAASPENASLADGAGENLGSTRRRDGADDGVSTGAEASDVAAVDDGQVEVTSVNWGVPQLDGEIRTRYVVEKAAWTDGHGLGAKPLLELEVGLAWATRVEIDVSGDINPLATLLAAAERQASPIRTGTPNGLARSSSRPISSASSAVGDGVVNGGGRKGSMLHSMSNLSFNRHHAATNVAMMARPHPSVASSMRRPAPSDVLTTPHGRTVRGSETSWSPNNQLTATPPVVVPHVARVPRNLLSLHFQLSVTHVALKADVKFVFFTDRIEAVVAPRPLLRWESVSTVGDSRAQVDVSYVSRIAHAAVGRALATLTSPNAFVLRKPSPPPTTPANVPVLAQVTTTTGLHFQHHSLRTNSNGRIPAAGGAGGLRTTSNERVAAAEAALASATTSTRWRLERRLATPVEELDEWVMDQMNKRLEAK